MKHGGINDIDLIYFNKIYKIFPNPKYIQKTNNCLKLTVIGIYIKRL